MPPSAAAAARAASAVTTSSRPLLIISIGNPGKEYASTYHSAGHILARSLLARQQQQLLPANWTVQQSKAYMNLSGPEVQKLLRRSARNNSSSSSSVGGEGTRLVILHDDLERELGQVRVRAGAASAQGHNGIKSIQHTLGTQLSSAPSRGGGGGGVGGEWFRVAIGVGRPASRDARAVADYVLSRASGTEMAKLEGALDKVVAELERLAAG